MLTIQSLRDDKDRILAALDKRHFDAREAIQQVLEWDAERRKTQAKLDDTLAQSNALSREIGGLMREGKKDEAEAVKAQTSSLKAQASELKEQMQSLETQIHDAVCHIPNAPHADVAAGRNAEDNVETFRSGDASTLEPVSYTHLTLPPTPYV